MGRKGTAGVAVTEDDVVYFGAVAALGLEFVAVST